jgi:tetratricopeptide (TPR) repeat protein
MVPFAVYVYFLCPTIAAGDTAELINCAAILGIPHAPGYPLFTMLGHVFTWLPLNSVAWRVNLSSAVFCALACLFVYLSLLRLTGRVWAALAGAWSLGFSRYFWHYAEVAEVFPLNNLFVALITYVLILIRDSLKDPKSQQNKETDSYHSLHYARRFFWLFCVLYGLGLTNHHTIVLLVPAALFFLWFSGSWLFFQEGKTLSIGVLLFFLGLVPYAYCPLAAMAEPLINWGNPATLENFFRLIFRMDFGTFSLGSVTSPSSRLYQLPAFFGSLYHQFTPLGIGLGLLGLAGARRHKLFQAYLGLSFFFSGVFFVVFANYPIQDPLRFGVLHRFYIMPAVIFSFWIGLGAAHLLGWLDRIRLPQAPCRLISVLLALGLFAWQFATNSKEADFRDNYMAEDFAHNLLLGLPKDALFFLQGDVASMGVDYLQLILKERTDVMKLNQAELTYDWYYKQAKKRFPDIVLRGESYDGIHTLNLHLVNDNIHQHPVCFRYFKEHSYRQAFRAVSSGLIHKMLPKNQPYSLKELEEHVNRLYAGFKKRGWQRDYPPTSFEHMIKRFYAEPFTGLGYEFDQAGEVEKAERYYRRALEIDPSQVATLKNLGILYFEKIKRPKEAVHLFRRYLELSPNDKDAEGIRRIIRIHDR